MVDAFNYVESRADVDEMIQEFGFAVQVRRDAKSGTDHAPTYTPTFFSTYGVRLEFTREQRASGNVLATDERWLVAAGPLAVLGVDDLTPFQSLIVAGQRKAMIAVAPFNPAGTVVLFDCHVRR